MSRDIEGLADLLAPSNPRDETKPHVSSLIAKILGDKDNDRPQNVINIMSLGRIWEEAVMRPAVEAECVIFTPNVSIERDGIIGTLDGVAHTDTDSYVWECKTRWTRYHAPEEHPRWLYQVKAYCYMMRMNKAWLTVLHLSTRPPNAESYWHELEFTDQQLAENWQMIVNARDYNPER